MLIKAIMSLMTNRHFGTYAYHYTLMRENHGMIHKCELNGILDYTELIDLRV